MLELDVYGTLVAASAVLLLGQQLLKRVRWLAAYTIPEPVVGGLLAAVLVLILRNGVDFQVRYDTSLGAPLVLSATPVTKIRGARIGRASLENARVSVIGVAPS